MFVQFSVDQTCLLHRFSVSVKSAGLSIAPSQAIRNATSSLIIDDLSTSISTGHR